jgi:hypothetical protein
MFPLPHLPRRAPPPGGAREGTRPPRARRCPPQSPTPPAIAHREVRDERRDEGESEAGVRPLLESRRHRRQQEHHAEELGPRQFHPEVLRKAEVREGLRDLRQRQLRVGGEAQLQAQQHGDNPEADDDAFGAGDAQGRKSAAAVDGQVHVVPPCHPDGSHSRDVTG